MTANKTAMKESDPKIPRPMNCFLAYRLEKQSEIVKRCPGANHRDISKIIAKWWKEASKEEKEPYRERARLAKAEHEKMFPNYKYTPQKKPARQTRKYTRRPQNKFTSRCEDNNRMMEHFFQKGAKQLDQPVILLSRDNPAVDAPVPPAKPVTPVVSKMQPNPQQQTIVTSNDWSNTDSLTSVQCSRSMNVIVTLSEDQTPISYQGSPLVNMDVIYPEFSYPSSPHSVCSSYASSVDACSPECTYLASVPLPPNEIYGMSSPVPARLQHPPSPISVRLQHPPSPLFGSFPSSPQAAMTTETPVKMETYTQMQPQFIDPRLLNAPLSMSYNQFYYGNHSVQY